MKAIKRSLVAGATLVGAAAAKAAAVDVTGVVTEIGAQVPSIVAVGGAVLTVVVAVKAFQWVRRALS